jgi:hypothetical protein
MADIHGMLRSRRVVRSALAGITLGVAFLFMASIFVPGRLQAGGDDLPDVPSTAYSAEAIEDMTPLGQIEGNEYTVKFYATPTGPLCSVYDGDGKEVAALLTLSQAHERFPDLALPTATADVPLAIMGSDLGGRH